MAKSKWLDPLRHRLVIATQAEHLLHVLQCGKVAINVYLRRMHNFALDMNWLPTSVIPKRQWPTVRFKDKRAITLEEHQKIIAAEKNPERKAHYQLCWHLGASQGDIANLKGEDVDWQNSTVSFVRKKTGVPVLVHLGPEALNVFKDLPSEGMLFPYLSGVRAGDRATEFGHQTLRDNVALLEDERLQQINACIAAAGREVFAKKAGAPVAALEVKVDSYVLETDVHFPTDVNLLWDAGRKCVDLIAGFRASGYCSSESYDSYEWI